MPTEVAAVTIERRADSAIDLQVRDVWWLRLRHAQRASDKVSVTGSVARTLPPREIRTSKVWRYVIT